MTTSHRIPSLLPFLALCALGACGGDDGVTDPREAYGSFEESTVFTYAGQAPLLTTGSMMGRSVATVVVGGKTIPRYQVVLDAKSIDDLVKPEGKPGFELWIGKDGDHMIVGGISDGGAMGLGITATVDPPVSVPLNPPLGVAQNLTFNATIKTESDPVGQAATLTATATLVETGVTVTAPMGPIAGCNRYTGSGTVSGPGIPAIAPKGPFNAEVWYSPTWGVVKANLPELGVSVGIAAEEDYAGSGPGATAIKRAGAVDDTNTNFTLSTYDRAQQLDADKRTHAKMLVELRWASDADAAALAPPGGADVDVSFNGGWGYFPHMLVESSSSYFFPEEKGFRYSYGYVSQALKNEGGTRGSAYSIYVNHDKPGVAAVRVTARIAYRVLTPEEMAEPMPEFK